MNFDEYLFIKALTERAEDAKRFSQYFEPSWLKTAELQPLLSKVFDFTKKHATPPTIDVLNKLFEDEDKGLYDARYKDIILNVSNVKYQVADAIYCLDNAKQAAITRSLEELFQSPEFSSYRENFEGPEIIRAIQRWHTQFEGTDEDIEFTIKDAVDDLIRTRSWEHKDVRIPTGIDVIDDWCGGGLRPKQLGLILGTSGAGKSSTLMIMAYKMAAVEQKKVLFISNELSMDEITERFGVLISGKDLADIQAEPTLIREGGDKLWKMGLDDRLYLKHFNREVSTNDIESDINRYINLYSWAPDVVVVDFMERMKPTAQGVKRDQSWNWYGEIAKDLVRISKKYNILVWSAGQINRQGYSAKNEQSLDQVQGSLKHIQEASAVIAIRKRDDYPAGKEDCNILEMRPLKMRHSKREGGSLLVEAFLGKMNITNNVRNPMDWANKDEDDEDFKGMKKTVK